jgi:hypothetical protein
MLLQLHGLSAKIEDYNAVLREQHPHAGDRRLLRQRLDSFIFAQVLVGARDRREGSIGRLNRAVAWITMVGLPIGTLLLLQLMFLPYHHELMTWWHRLCVLADLGLVWFFWARVGGAEDAAPAASAAEQREPRIGALAAFSGTTLPAALGRIAAGRACDGLSSARLLRPAPSLPSSRPSLRSTRQRGSMRRGFAPRCSP